MTPSPATLARAAKRLGPAFRLLAADARALGFLGLAASLLSTLVLAPCGGWVLDLLIRASRRVAVSNAEIIAFLLSPAGALAALVFGGLLVLARDAAEALVHLRLEHPSLPPRAALRALVSRAPRMLGAGMVLAAALAAACLPFLLGALAVKAGLLAAHDINYYLDRKPVEWRVALGAAACLALGAAAAAVVVQAALLRVTPGVALDGLRVRAAVAASVAAFRSRPGDALAQVVVHQALTVSCGVALATAGAEAGSRLVNALPDRTGPLLAAAIAVTLAQTLAGAGLSFVSTALGAAMLRILDGRAPRSAPTPQARPWSGAIAATWGLAFVLAAGFALPAALRILHPAGGLEPPAIIAHRGASLAAPENSRTAFRIAAEAGADWIELDVQRDASGTVVVLHDRDFMRVARDPRRLENLTTEQWQSIRLRSARGEPAPGERAPTLAEVLAMPLGAAGLMIELKYNRPDAGLAAAVAGVLAASPKPARLAMLSLELQPLLEFKRLRPDIPVGLLVAASAGKVLETEADFLAISARLATTRFLDRAERSGRPVYAWTVNSESDMLRLMVLGVQGIITDDPALAVRVRERHAALAPSEYAALVLRTRLRE